MVPRSIRTKSAVLLATTLFALSGCAGANRQAEGPVFFPPAPNLPRVQFLMGINSSEDVEGKESKVSLISLGGKEEKAVQYLLKPYGLAAAGGKVYVTDMASQLVVIDFAKKKFERLKGDNGIGKVKQPVKAAVDSMGYLYVADLGRKEILVYDQQGEFVKGIGRELDVFPADVAVDEDRLYILDMRKGVIRVLDRQSEKPLMEIGNSGQPESTLNMPMGMTLDKNGVIRVTDAGLGKVLSFDRDGHFLSAFGQIGDGFGQFSRPKGITTDPNGMIFVVDSAFQNVQVFNDKGRIAMFFGGIMPEGGMNLPAGIALTTENLPFFQERAEKNFQLEEVVLVTNQFGSPKLNVYGFGKQKGVDYEKEYDRLRQERERKAREDFEKHKKEEALKKGTGAPQ